MSQTIRPMWWTSLHIQKIYMLRYRLECIDKYNRFWRDSPLPFFVDVGGSLCVHYKALRALVAGIEVVCQVTCPSLSHAVSVDKADTSAAGLPARTVQALCTVWELDCYISNGPFQRNSSYCRGVCLYVSSTLQVFLSKKWCRLEGQSWFCSLVCECPLLTAGKPSSYARNCFNFPLGVSAYNVLHAGWFARRY